MKPHSILCFLLLAALSLAHAQGTGVQLRGCLATAGGTVTGGTTHCGGHCGEASPTGGAASGSFTLSSGARVPDQVARILQYTLTAGWHILGAPGTSDATAGEIFVGARGATIKVGPIQYYDTAALRYHAGGNDEALEARRGFWLFSYWGGESRTFTAEPGMRVSNWLAEIPRGGWVLYSPPGKIILDDEPGRTVFAWDTEGQTYVQLGPGDYLEPLHGYWIYREPAE
jgi:hypothetical protein